MILILLLDKYSSYHFPRVSKSDDNYYRERDSNNKNMAKIREPDCYMTKKRLSHDLKILSHDLKRLSYDLKDCHMT